MWELYVPVQSLSLDELFGSIDHYAASRLAYDRLRDGIYQN